MKKFTSEKIKKFCSKPLFNEKIILSKNSNYPKISVVIPLYNQVEFLERTILSILNQNYPSIEIIIIDGGSTDGSINIIKKYEKYIDFWISEPDNGQSNAINKGFKIATGELVGWLNSDDIYLKDSFLKVAEIYKKNKNYDVYFGNSIRIDSNDNILNEVRFTSFSLNSLLYRGWNIAPQTTFFKNYIIKEYLLDESLEYVMDGDLFVRLAIDKKKFKFIRQFFGCFRIQPHSKTQFISKTIGIEEWIKIKKNMGLNIKEGVLFHKQFIIQRLYCLFRGTLLYLIQGDLDYILKGIIKRL